uniref:Uncharacterized protein n=1 Tax=Candidatus Kentrum sp. LFY TaxID=2126342 RepID=A0A450WJ08_9GAMM|nr:MAG: hypothetical protein BECKLFY1418C_GA0070996_102817 [Candidatus Kentron sp. LFY]
MNNENANSNNPEEEKTAIRNLAYFIGVAIVIGTTAETLIRDQSNYLAELFYHDTSIIPADIICIMFTSLHHIRLWFGINYIQSDESFGAALTAVTRHDRAMEKDIRKKEARLNLTLIVTAVLFIIFLKGGYFGIEGLIFILGVQSYIIIRYNVLFFKVMYIEDKQKAANVFIAVGDGVVIIFTLILLAYACLYKIAPQVHAYPTSILSIALGALLSVFIGECISQYIPAFILLLRKTVNAVK